MAKQRGSWKFEVGCDSSNSIVQIVAIYQINDSKDTSLSCEKGKVYTLSGADATSLDNVASALSTKINADESL